MIEKLNENASLSDLITTFESCTSNLQTIKNNIVNTLGSPATSGDKLSVIPNRIKTILDVKDTTISQLIKRKRWASGSFDATSITSIKTVIPLNLDFTPSILVVNCYLDLNFKNLSSARSILRFATNLSSTATINYDKNTYGNYPTCIINNVSAKSFTLNFELGNLNGLFFRTANATLSWKAIE
ncbi:TPA: hypothetical protein SOK69_003573, partial [Clostridioides difficile]|uniref:hypothetical protein n=1 Tax=Clostridioides difficile TaxID=1496 RepID=UPI00093DCEC2|nr:hypothetical protein [Clostridioides difficile]MDL0290940.1 hypothetical protein [Clostridioides difficile]SJQ65426.1 Uncharacterised protein [Clostridioides difficile]HBE8980353.1 hypothetical protein [Clostridioides difficile]HBF2386900.1 hypothetical protein [Clostridioides difficile]HBF4429092.1 hypothetical protein [Clostridioides difficile]